MKKRKREGRRQCKGGTSQETNEEGELPGHEGEKIKKEGTCSQKTCMSIVERCMEK
jgi:hypothetical protein